MAVVVGDLNREGIRKAQLELSKRLAGIDLAPSEGERVARVMAWDAYMWGLVKYEDPNEVIQAISGILYERALARNGEMDIEEQRFRYCLFNELGEIKKRMDDPDALPKKASGWWPWVVGPALILYGFFALLNLYE